MFTYYKNRNTGEITDDRADARYWYEANGDVIEYYKNGRLVCVWGDATKEVRP